MNEFVEQFLVESRELIQQGTEDLLALEEAPRDKDRLDSAFRAFHTLKGGSSIVDFTAMTEALHVAETALAGLRSGANTVSASLIDDCLSCLDQVGRWLDAMERTGEVPHGAQKEADVIVARFAGSQATLSTTATQHSQMSPDWAKACVARWSMLCSSAQTLVRYTPDASCFYGGEDPLARVAALPGLLAIDLEPTLPWDHLATADPFACNLVITALTGAPATEVIAYMESAAEQCEIVGLADTSAVAEKLPTVSPMHEVLQAQLGLIDTAAGTGAPGCWASAGRVAANVLRNAGRTVDADSITQSTALTLAQSDPRCLRQAIADVMAERTMARAPATAPAGARVAAMRTLRVDALQIDDLVNLTGELVVAKNSIGHVAALAEQGDLSALSLMASRHAVLDRLVGQLQRTVLGLRVLPLRHVFQRFPRLLREMSIDLGKPVNLVVEGGETEADKVIVEMLFEPLLHVLRNAIDHGVENPSDRAARSKAPIATILLRGERRGEQVIVEISDDGRGIDAERIRQVAIEKDLVTADALDALRDDAVLDLIFEPGFSTAANVTRVSGRGVGMDAVRSAVQQVGGRVAIDNRPGEGVTVRFTMPFSVMMTRVMVVSVGDRAFGIPLEAVVETLRVSATSVTAIGTTRAVILRNRTVPLVTLAESLGLSQDQDNSADATVVVLSVGGEYAALQVDRVRERMDVMLKPLDGLLTGTRGIAGSTLVGDGSVLLILDVDALLQ